ncbi:hypothetical protein P8452_56420 [Trifolium repens]|nr:hypothetical protein P8452_56420 [Trifolium repens]
MNDFPSSLRAKKFLKYSSTPIFLNLAGVRRKIPQFCDDNGAYVVVTDYGEGDRTDFIMSPRALLLNGYLGFENVYCLL